MVPVLAHIHTEGPVQLRNVLGPFLQEVLGFNPGQLLSPLLLELYPLLVHTAPIPLLLDQVATPSPWVGCAGAAGGPAAIWDLLGGTNGRAIACVFFAGEGIA